MVSKNKKEFIVGLVGLLAASTVYMHFLDSSVVSDRFLGTVFTLPAVLPGIVLGLTAILFKQRTSIIIFFVVAIFCLPIVQLGLLLVSPYFLLGIIGMITLVPTNLIAVTVGIFVAIVLMPLHKHLKGKYTTLPIDAVVAAILVITFLIMVTAVVVKENRESTIMKDEQNKRSLFLKNILVASTKDRLETYSTSEVIELNLADGIYQVNDGEIINGFGGTVNLNLEEEILRLTYDNIPNGEQCFQFYYSHPNIKSFNFKKLRINNIAEYDFPASAQGIESFRNATCDDGEYKANTFIYEASLSEFKKSAWQLI